MKMSRILILPAFALAIISLQSFAPQQNRGESLYGRKCERCHGEDGTKGAKAAENLKESTISDAAIIKIITEGKRKMPAYGDRMSAEDIKAVAGYVKTLRK